MKKTLITLICLLILNNAAHAAQNNNTLFKQGVNAYKNENYIESADTMKKVISQDPGNALAHYYLAISYAQIGKSTLAIQEYNNVIKLNPNSQLADYANLGIKQVNETPQPQNNTSPLPTIDKSVTPQSENTENEKPSQKNSYNAPTEEELANAIQILSRAGLNTGMNTGINNTFNPEALKMNMLMSSLGGFGDTNNMNNNNAMGGMGGNNNMLQYMLMMQNQGNGKNSNPQMTQDMLNSMMIPDMFSNNYNMGN